METFKFYWEMGTINCLSGNGDIQLSLGEWRREDSKLIFDPPNIFFVLALNSDFIPSRYSVYMKPVLLSPQCFYPLTVQCVHKTSPTESTVFLSPHGTVCT